MGFSKISLFSGDFCNAPPGQSKGPAGQAHKQMLIETVSRICMKFVGFDFDNNL